MKIKHKYLRNKHFRNKNWKRIRNTEHPFRTICPWTKLYSLAEWFELWPYEKQVRENFEDIDLKVWGLESGANTFLNAPSHFRRLKNRQRKSRERTVMVKINQGDYEAEVPVFKRNVNAEYF